MVETNNKEHDLTPAKYWNVLRHNITQKQLRHLDISGHFYQNDNANLMADVYLHAKNELHP